MKKFSIVVIVDGYTLKATSDGTEEGTSFEGEEEHIAMTKALIRMQDIASIGHVRFGPTVVCGYESPLSLTAAMLNSGYDDGKIWRVPKEVTEYLEEYASKHHYERKFYGDMAKRDAQD